MQSHVTKPTLMVNFSTTVSTRGHPKLKLRYRLPSGDSKTKSCNGSPYPTINEAFQPPNKGYRGSISSSDCKEQVLVTTCEKTFYFFFFFWWALHRYFFLHCFPLVIFSFWLPLYHLSSWKMTNISLKWKYTIRKLWQAFSCSSYHVKLSMVKADQYKLIKEVTAAYKNAACYRKSNIWLDYNIHVQFISLKRTKVDKEY